MKSATLISALMLSTGTTIMASGSHKKPCDICKDGPGKKNRPHALKIKYLKNGRNDNHQENKVVLSGDCKDLDGWFPYKGIVTASSVGRHRGRSRHRSRSHSKSSSRSSHRSNSSDRSCSSDRSQSGSRHSSPRHKGMKSHSPRHKGMKSHSPRHKGKGSKSPRHKGKGSKSPRHKGKGSHSPRHKGKGSKSPRHKGKGSHSPRHKGKGSKSPRRKGMSSGRKLLMEDEREIQTSQARSLSGTKPDTPKKKRDRSRSHIKSHSRSRSRSHSRSRSRSHSRSRSRSHSRSRSRSHSHSRKKKHKHKKHGHKKYRHKKTKLVVKGNRVTDGSVFKVFAVDGNSFPSKTTLTITGRGHRGKKKKCSVKFITSCSKPLKVGDQFGPFKILGDYDKCKARSHHRLLRSLAKGADEEMTFEPPNLVVPPPPSSLEEEVVRNGVNTNNA